MNHIDSEDLILRTLQCTFPQAARVKIIEKSIGGDGLNFTSEILYLTVQYKKNDESHLEHLMLKIPAVSRPTFPLYILLNIYHREVYTYEKVLPFVNKLLDTNISPTHYSTVDPNILVLENLTARGYGKVPARKFFDFHQFRPLLKTLAKFHAASFLVHQQQPHLSNENIFNDERLAAELQPLTNEWISVICEILNRTNASHLIPRVKAILSTISHENGIKKMISSKNFNFVVLNHGDYRGENLLIKYDEEQLVKDIKIIDFQFCSWSSPVQDFLYCMIMSVKPDLMEEHFDSFVNVYTQYLQKTLSGLGCHETYDKTDFMVDFEKIKLFMNLALVSLCCILSNSINLGKQNTGINLPNQIPHSELLSNEDFVLIVSDWFKYFEKVGALNASYIQTAEPEI